MSDIIYTPPASSGGTTINPTNNFIPVRSNATTFVDSILQCVPNSFVQSVRSGVGLGISTSFTLTTAETYIGDFNNLIDSKFIKVQNDTVTSRIYSSNSGFYLDFNGKTYRFGDYNNVNNGIYLNVDDQGRQVSFTDNNVIDGLFLNYAGNIYQLGQITSNNIFTIDANNAYANINVGGNTLLLLDNLNGIGTFFDYANGNGLEFIAPNKTFFLNVGGGNVIEADYNSGYLILGNPIQPAYISMEFNAGRSNVKLGDVNAQQNATYMIIDDLSQEILSRTENLVFQGTNIQSNSSSGNSGEHLVITLNGNQYKIKLENP